MILHTVFTTFMDLETISVQLREEVLSSTSLHWKQFCHGRDRSIKPWLFLRNAGVLIWFSSLLEDGSLRVTSVVGLVAFFLVAPKFWDTGSEPWILLQSSRTKLLLWCVEKNTCNSLPAALTHCLQDVDSVIYSCYWFEGSAWWRIVKKAPCLPDVILRKTERDITSKGVTNLQREIRSTNGRYCDGRIEDDLGRDSVLLERKQ